MTIYKTSNEPKTEDVIITANDSLSLITGLPVERSLTFESALDTTRKTYGYQAAYVRETFSDELWLAMEHRNLTQAQFAERAKVPKQFLTKVFRGGNCTMDTIVKLSHALDYHVHIHLTPNDISCAWIHVVQEITVRQRNALHLWSSNEFKKVTEDRKELEYATFSPNP